jgi:hypothetical protein
LRGSVHGQIGARAHRPGHLFTAADAGIGNREQRRGHGI